MAKFNLNLRKNGPAGEVLSTILKVPGSNPMKCSAGIKDPTSLRGSRWRSGRKLRKCSDSCWVSVAFPSTMA